MMRIQNLERNLTIFIIILFMACTSFADRIIYVNDDATGANDGTSWENAYIYLQDALADANSAEKPVEIRVAQGVYKPDRGVGQTPGDREATFQLLNDVMLKGGFSGISEVDPNLRDIEVYKTLLSGDLGSNDLEINHPEDLRDEPSRTDNSYHILIAVDCNDSACIEGFVIMAGNANGNHDEARGRGAGLYNSCAGPAIKQCIFIGNYATRGGVVYNNYRASECHGGDVAFSKCFFKANSANYGGAIYLRSGKLELIDCIFVNNSATTSGGAIYSYESYTCINCIFNGNRGNYGGGIHNHNCGPTLTNCLIVNNKADLNGGGIYNYPGRTTINNCILWGNSDGFGTGESAQACPYYEAYTFNHCCVQGCTDNITNTAVTGKDPMFIDLDGPDNIPGNDDDDLRLLAVSPCIDTGDNTAVEELTLTDIQGNPRIIGEAVDMGAYEGGYQGIAVRDRNIVVPESSQSSIAVILAKDPGGTVEINVEVVECEPELTIISEDKLYFDSSNFFIPQYVGLSAGHDPDYLPGQAVIELSGVGLHTINLNVNIPDVQRPTVLYVDDSATGADDGTNWYNAFVNLQDALVTARLVPSILEIQVAQGIYKPDQGGGNTLGNITATFNLISNIKIKGGYAGAVEPDPNERDVELYGTILNGDLENNDRPIDEIEPYNIDKDPSRTDNSLRVVTSQVLDPNTFIDGFIVTAATEAGLYISNIDDITICNCTFAYNAASGIVCYASEPNIIDCTFEYNFGNYNDGGGIQIRYGSTPRIIQCTFKNNWAPNGGGLYSIDSKLWLEDCEFIHNTASGLWYADVGYGGGVYVEFYKDGTKIENCSFTENAASTGGGAGIGHHGMFISSREEETILLSECTFIRNQASFGGAISQYRSTLNINDCEFHNNYSVNGFGGAIEILSSITNLNNCIFSGNLTTSRRASISKGASISATGTREVAIHIWKYPQNFEIMLNNCTFRGNISSAGGTFYCRSHDSKELDNTIITNCIFDNGGNEINNPDGSQITIDYTNIRGGLSSIDDPCNAVIWGKGNMDVDPLFANPGYWDPNGTPEDPNDDFWIEGDYHLKSQAGRWNQASETWYFDDVTSPCIDAGDPNSPMAFEPEPNGRIINMGAYGGTAEASKSYSAE